MIAMNTPTKFDPLAYWRRALDAASKGQDLPTIEADKPEMGYYKLRNGRNAPWLPVAIYYENGELTARVAGDTRNPLEIWTWCASHPVSKDDARYAFKHGSWPGDAPTIGHNSGPDYSDDFDGISRELDDYVALCAAFVMRMQDQGGVKTKAEADQANNMADAVGDVKNGIARRADERRKVEVQPHLDAQREINGRYMPLVTRGKSMAETLRILAAQWARAEEKRLQAIADAEAKARQDEANRKAEEMRARFEADAERARAAGVPDHELLPPVEALAPVIQAETVKVQIGGQRGAKRSLKERRIARVTDYAACLAHFAQAPDVVAAVEKCAQRAVDAKMPTPPGVQIAIEERL